MARKMICEQFWSGEMGAEIIGTLALTTRIKINKETGEAKTEPAWSVTPSDGVAWVMPDHYALAQMLEKNAKPGDRVSLRYHGNIGPKVRGKDMAVWTGFVLDENDRDGDK